MRGDDGGGRVEATWLKAPVVGWEVLVIDREAPVIDREAPVFDREVPSRR